MIPFGNPPTARFLLDRWEAERGVIELLGSTRPWPADGL